MGRFRILIWIAVAVTIPGLLLMNLGLWDLSQRTVRHHVEAIGGSIYEFHNHTGRWPEGADDLSQTSLPLKLPYWRTLIESGNVVVVWHKDLDVDPAKNAHRILAYHNQGLLAAFGKVVCWGDLRSAYVSKATLRAGI